LCIQHLNPGTRKLHAWTQQPTRLPALDTAGQSGNVSASWKHF
jgi:hypothetical protein